MQARMKNPVFIIPEAMTAIQALQAAVGKSDVAQKTLHLIHLRASQINGCATCIDGGVRLAQKSGETAERLFAVAAWRHAPYFTDAERAALALAEAVTRLADREDAVPDEVWNEARRHYDERALSGLLLFIGLTNVFNRLNVATAQPAGEWKP
ncbi:MAG TPA: carboxymuconolactone decarboxylase family protein [Polyangia bacterium]|nr:carboxymuconolactone decarboxylase family protein [Polyangia bacterium]